MNTDQIICGDSIEVLAGLPEKSVHCVVTSPPYWGLRDYGTEGQLGLEKTPEEYVAKMVEVFRAVRRVLRDDGTLWLNLGDSYASGPAGNIEFKENPLARQTTAKTDICYGGNKPKMNYARAGLKPKDLCGIPWRVAFALQADGWYLRSDIIWAKPNPMPESVTDRPTKAHEYLFLLTKSPRYFYDMEAIREPHQNAEREANRPSRRANMKKSVEAGYATYHIAEHQASMDHPMAGHPSGRNRRSVWTIPTSPYPEAHFATFPPKLVEPCIKAGTSEKGCCPECGKPWERVVAKDRKATRPGKDNVLDPTGLANRDPGRHVTEVNTTGWRPNCDCYGLEIIEDQPTKGRDEKPRLYVERLAAWQARWETLSPFYEAATKAPCTAIDPFAGSGTTCMVAAQLGRSYIGIELSEEYCELARTRIGASLKPETYTKADVPADATLFGGTE